ncbi:hypothetical protein [Methylobacterium radiodurans]|uniref:Uncharacterized protein n=1 Tax=Methylobacterium radiodurans TaxID=2202828 RepID=A0A2U8VMG8_9HYPH|nr:hypothetical protein [Methylobacterium radiodurans]AWN34824.1 hypothetical protein DK427_02940 [Methylobacterium radiodurans]
MARFGLIALALLATSPSAARAADPHERHVLTPAPAPITGRFLATCEDLGRFCFAEGCGRDQIDAALACRAACPSSAVMTVQPVACPIPGPPVRVVLRRRG